MTRAWRADRLLAEATAAADAGAAPWPAGESTVYAAAPFLRLRYEQAGFFAYQPVTDTLRRLDRLPAWLMQEVDGMLSVADLAARSRVASVTTDATGVGDCLEGLRQAGFVHICRRRTAASRSRVEGPFAGPCTNGAAGVPLFAFWEPTLRCNLYCQSCYNSSGPKAPDGVDRMQIVAALAASGVLRVTLLGGEPMMMPDFYPVIAALESAGIGVEFVTNGWFLTERFLDPLLRTRVARLMVSIDGDLATNDRLRGRAGAFTRAIEGIRLYAEHGFAITGSLTLMSSNVQEMSAVIEQLVRAGVCRIKVRPLVPEGRGHDCFSREGLDRGAYESCCDTLQTISRSLPDTVELRLVVANDRILRDDAVGEDEVSSARDLGDSGLEWDTFYVRYDGKICRSSFERNVVLGDMRSDPLSAVWRRMAPAA
jgi:MoaA/NifB/PqqE/SkfB family radical SAM enzyme